MIKPGRSFSSSAYKHGFNTNESDAEVTGSFGNTYTAEYWMYDSRLGRRWERDPITYPWQSPYACFNNNPIFYNDVRGLEGDPPTSSNPGPNGEIGGNMDEGFDLHEATICGNCDNLPNVKEIAKISTDVQIKIYNAADIKVRNQVFETGDNVLKRGILYNESKGKYNQLYDSRSPYNKTFQSNFNQGFQSFKENGNARFWSNAAGFAGSASIGAVIILPVAAEQSGLLALEIYDVSLTTALRVYFKWQVHTGTVSGVGAGGILLGRGMLDYVIPQAQRLGLGYLRMPAFVQWGNRLRPMLEYNRLWLNFHLNSNTPISVMTNASGNATFYSPTFTPSPFMEMELRILIDYYKIYGN